MTSERIARENYRARSDGGAGADHAAKALGAEASARAYLAMKKMNDPALRDRAFAILHRMATEQTGWRGWFRRWYYSDEPLRNDAANLVREAGFGMPMPIDTRLVGD